MMNGPHIALVWLDFGLLAFLGGGLLLWRRTLVKSLPRIARTELLVLLLLGGLHAVLLKPRVPQALWHEQHAVSIVRGIDSELYTGGLDDLHGPTYSNIMRLMRRLTGGRISVFSLNYLVSLAGILLLFLFVRLLPGRDPPALTAAAMLLYLPVHTRLAATESMFIPLEALLLLTLLLTAVYMRSRDPRHLMLALAACVLAAWLRAEMLLLAPLLPASYILLCGEKQPRGFYARPAFWLPVLAAAALLAARATELLALSDPRIAQTGVPPEWENLRAQGLHAFFSLRYTPLPYLLLLPVGVIRLFPRNKKLALWLGAAWALTAYCYAPHLTCVSLVLRTSLASQFLLIIFAAYGFDFAAGKARTLHPAAPYALLAALLSCAPLLRWDFLTTLYTTQQEHRFLERIAAELPDKAVVVYLAQDDEPDLLQNRVYQRDLLEMSARRRGKSLAASGIQRYREAAGRFQGGNVFFYAGLPCVTLSWKQAAARPEGPADYVNPLCRWMRDDRTLTPVVETAVTDVSLSWDKIQGARRTLGLYRIKDAAAANGLPGAGEYFTPPADRRRMPRAGFWVRAAESAQRRGMRWAALRALAIAQAAHAPSPENARRISSLYLIYERPARAWRALKPFRDEPQPAHAPIWLELAKSARRAGKHDLALKSLTLAENSGLDAKQLAEKTKMYRDLLEVP
ncbi:MAG: glycosyltransferase family 39 protein [Elusimicrobiota bacterium]